MKYKAFAMTDVGRMRDQNEDAFVMDPSIGVYAVCDGVRKCTAGDIASQTAVDTVYAQLHEHYGVLRRYRKESSAAHRREALEAISNAVRRANLHLRRIAREQGTPVGVCSTISMLVLMGKYAVIAHVGDSRAYLCRDGRTYQLTTDHSVPRPPTASPQGLPAPAQPTGTLITRALGQSHDVHPDLIHMQTMPGDRFLLCTDGVSDYFEKPELSRALTQLQDGKTIDYLVKMANERGGKDNITAVTVEAFASEEDKDHDKPRTILSRWMMQMRQNPLFETLKKPQLLDALHRTIDVVADEAYTLKTLLADTMPQATPANSLVSIPTTTPRSSQYLLPGDDSKFTQTAKFRKAAHGLELLTRND